MVNGGVSLKLVSNNVHFHQKVMIIYLIEKEGSYCRRFSKILIIICNWYWRFNSVCKGSNSFWVGHIPHFKIYDLKFGVKYFFPRPFSIFFLINIAILYVLNTRDCTLLLCIYLIHLNACITITECCWGKLWHEAICTSL